MAKWFKRLLSHLTKKPVHSGYGVSCDDTITVKTLPNTEQVQVAQAESRISAKYTLRQELGAFELIGPVRRGDQVRFQLRHILTGTKVVLDKELFELFFEKTSSR